MKKVTSEVTVYRFEELTEDAKLNAIDSMGLRDFDHEWSEIRATMKAFEEHLNVRFRGWEIDPSNSTPTRMVKVEVPWYFEDSEDEENIENLRDAIERLGSYDAETLVGNGDCVLTGVFWDEEMADGARYEFYRQGITERASVAKMAFTYLESAIHREYEDRTSEETAQEIADASDYWFTEDGEVWHD